MTYGEYLRFCRKLAGMEKKTDFARKLGLLDCDHYIGAENDVPSKKPSLDLLERAARAVDMEFSQFIQEPKPRKLSRKHEQLHRQLQELLDLTGQDAEAALWLEISIRTFFKAYFKRR